MKCLVCKTKIPETKELCEKCDRLMDMLYKKHPENKEFTLEIFRKENRRKK